MYIVDSGCEMFNTSYYLSLAFSAIVVKHCSKLAFAKILVLFRYLLHSQAAHQTIATNALDTTFQLEYTRHSMG